MAAVNQTNGWVDNNKISLLTNWKRENTIENALEALRKEMDKVLKSGVAQPAEGAVFP